MAERMPRRSSEVSSKRFLLKLYCRPARLNIPSSVNALSDFCLTLAFWPVGALLRRHYGRQLTLSAAELRLQLWVKL